MPMAPRRLQQAQLHGHSAILADLRSQKTSKTASILGTGQSTGCTSQAAGVHCKIGGWTGIIPKDMAYKTPEEDLVVSADNFCKDGEGWQDQTSTRL
ncbi:TPA: hypothetical protein ACH3X1_001227 [Trebouxia sp. C0004]